MLLALAIAAIVAGGSLPSACSYDPAILKLGVDAFDQDLSGGWRALAERPECVEVAADLVHKYREHQQSMINILYWHEGQLRAGRGENDAAIAPFELSRQPGDERGWNEYVDATIAFLKHDKPALLAARAKLSRRPPGPEFIESNGQRISLPPGPMNLAVVDKLIKHYGQTYNDAYDSSD